MKVYIVTSHFGQYEDTCQNVDGVFANPADAESCKKTITDSYTELATKELSDADLESLTDEEIEVIIEEDSIIYAARDFNFCDVKEYEVIANLSSRIE